jgi:PAS domain S-box-containing protein
VEFIDDKIEELTGYPRAEFESRRMKWVDLILPEDIPAAKRDFLRGRETNGAYYREFRIRTRDGRILWLQDRGQMIFNRQGQIDYVSGVFFDASEAQRAKMALLESERRLRFLASQLLTAQEQERKRISMELHDELGQSLTVMKLQIRAIEEALQGDQPELRQEFAELRKYVDGIIENVRRLSRDLSPAILEDLGLLASLKYLLEGLGRHITVKFSLEVEDLDRLFPLKAQIIIYRIFQECLNNIAKHAGASQVSVELRREGEAVIFTLEDDGVGFKVDQVMGQTPQARGLGLAAINERARMLGGTCKVWSQPGVGTKVVCTIPVPGETEKSAAS